MYGEIKSATVEFVERPFLKPLIISSGAISSLSEAIASVVVQVDESVAVGRGSIYLSDLWAWPDSSMSHQKRDMVLRGLCTEIAEYLHEFCGGAPAHPLELGLTLHDRVCEDNHLRSPGRIPSLALAMCISPFDAAIHDAAGIATGRSAFSFYGDLEPFPTADRYFGRVGACGAIRQMLTSPKERLKAWYLAGKNDTVDDLSPWIRDRGYRCIKIKLHGQETAEDVERTIEIHRMARALGADTVELSVDTNEANFDAESVRDYLVSLRAADEVTYAALSYLEQPTGRNIEKHAFNWREVAGLKPVLLDEGLTDLNLMVTAARQGWSGFALKTCKGHSFALVAAAWAHRHGLLLSMQDLTNPGLSAIHAALFAAHVPAINGIELNSPQFTPAANREWLPRLSGLFDPSGGYHTLSAGVPVGLGSVL